MRNPYNRECPYFYGDYYRGREKEECRLFTSSSSTVWQPDYCKNCPVPDIVLANACSNMVLELKLKRKLPFIQPQLQVNTYCNKTKRHNFDPYVGCGECHQKINVAIPGDEK